jgi:hypothetical protein
VITLLKNSNSLLGDLLRCHEKHFATDATKTTLMNLIALTGFTSHPIAGRVVGNGPDQETYAQHIEKMLGYDRCRVISNLTDAGILSLGDPNFAGLQCIICSGPITDPDLKLILQNAFRHLPLRSLDGSPLGSARYREMDRNLSWIILRADEVSDPEILRNSLSIRINESTGSVRRNLQDVVQEFGNAATPDNDPEITAIRQRIALIPWTRRVLLPLQHINDDRIEDLVDVSRLKQLFALARVVRLLNWEPSENRDPLIGDLADIEVVLQIMDAAKVSDDRQRLSEKEVQTLRILQLNRDKFLARKNSGSTATGASSGPNHAGPFTLYNVMEVGRFAVGEDMIAHRFKALENLGLIRANGKIGRMNAWDLTERGKSYERAWLSDRLRHLVSSSENSEAIPSENPRSSVDQAPDNGAI